MNSYERARRNHPAQIHADRRALELMEHYYDETAPEITYQKRRKRRRKQDFKQDVKQELARRFAMMWRY